MDMNNLKERIQASMLIYIDSMPSSRLKEAAIYAIQAGGKRFRPLLILAILKSYGLDPIAYVDLATSIEMVHLYSLIHDDLPAMDDDALRHGVPTIHRQFDEATAILLGDGLLTNAFVRITQASWIQSDKRVVILERLATHAGLTGMVYGQHLDLEAEGKQVNENHLTTISHYKTGKLLEAACRIAAILAAPDKEAQWGELGLDLGLMFQIQDDVLEVEQTETVLRKSKSDLVLEKATFVSQLGLEASKKKIQGLYQQIQAKLNQFHLKNQTVTELINTIYDRRF